MADILLVCAAGLTLAWLVAAQRRLVARAVRRFVSLPRVEQTLLVLAVGVMTVCAQKQRTENS
jgi:cellobiose-specific phosphotransferase system component IIB